MKIVPLTGQVLIEILPRDQFTVGGIEIPDRLRSPEEVQAGHHSPEKPPPWQGVVREVGAWPKLPNGMAVLPEYGRGARVLIGSHAGVQMQRNLGEKFRMVAQRDILAILSESV